MAPDFGRDPAFVPAASSQSSLSRPSGLQSGVGCELVTVTVEMPRDSLPAFRTLVGATDEDGAGGPWKIVATQPRDWWKPDPEDPFWMLEAEDGEWLKNEHSWLGTRDPSKALRFPTAEAARKAAHVGCPSKWWRAKPTEHSWIVG